MAYYLMVEKKKGLYQPLNIKNSKYYPYYNTRYTKTCAHTLQEIDEFTTQFDDEKELRERLVEEGILQYQLLDKPLSIRQPQKGMYTKVPYDLLYQDSIEYIMEPTRLVSLIMNKYYQNDFIFIKKLANHFSEFYECKTTGPEVARLAEASLYQGYRHKGLEEIDRNGDFMVARMIKLLILKHYEQPDGKINYKSEVNYRNLHELIAFIKHKDKEEILTNDNITENVQPKITSKRKTRSKKKYILDDQTSFDI